MPRKTDRDPHRAGTACASMRPRPDATENEELLRAEPAEPKASMRPRPDATENRVAHVEVVPGLTASMRPRPDATENKYSSCFWHRRQKASMRPRPDATENAGGSPGPATRARCFNEAAARCHGKHPTCGRRRCSPAACFNEAAARCHGKRRRGRCGSRWRGSFNEAAARCHGKRFAAKSSRPSRPALQ